MFLARQTQRLAEKNPQVTICQVRDAANTLVDTLSLSSEQDRGIRLKRQAQIIRQTQRSNAAARASHTKTRHQQLRTLGIRVSTLRCCIPP